jgi:hypothetical protein
LAAPHIFLHSVLSIAFFLRLTSIFLKSSSTSSSHLFLGFPLLLPPPEMPCSALYDLPFCLHGLAISWLHNTSSKFEHVWLRCFMMCKTVLLDFFSPPPPPVIRPADLFWPQSVQLILPTFSRVSDTLTSFRLIFYRFPL